jgi:hypothetical protein
MATIGEHNQLIKIVYDGNAHLKHILSDEDIKRMTLLEERFPLTKLPVCGSCEKLAMWSRGMTGTCRSCGTITKNPITYSSYLASGYDVDATGQTARSVLQKREVQSIILPDYGNMGRK